MNVKKAVSGGGPGPPTWIHDVVSSNTMTCYVRVDGPRAGRLPLKSGLPRTATCQFHGTYLRVGGGCCQPRVCCPMAQEPLRNSSIHTMILIRIVSQSAYLGRVHPRLPLNVTGVLVL